MQQHKNNFLCWLGELFILFQTNFPFHAANYVHPCVPITWSEQAISSCVSNPVYSIFANLGISLCSGGNIIAFYHAI